MTLRPVITLPVKAILSISMWEAIALPVVAPNPGTTFTTDVQELSATAVPN